MADLPFTALGERIRDAMMMHGIRSARSLAKSIEVSHQTLHRWLHEDQKYIDVGAMLRLSDRLNVSMRYLVDGSGGPIKHRRVTLEEAELLDILATLSDRDRQALIAFAQRLSATHQP